MKTWVHNITAWSLPFAACILLAGFWFFLPPAKTVQAQSSSMTDKGVEVESYLQTIFSARKGVDPDQFRRKWLALPYADVSASQQLDIYLPETGEGPFPVVVALHGGSFAAGDKGDFQIVPMLAALKRGSASPQPGCPRLH